MFLDKRSVRLAARLRELGATGIGQSSWGPTVFAMVENESKGYQLAEQIHADAASAEYDCILAKCANHGTRGSGMTPCVRFPPSPPPREEGLP